MSDSNEENISEILFDPKVSEILELLENGPEHESKICKHLSIMLRWGVIQKMEDRHQSYNL